MVIMINNMITNTINNMKTEDTQFEELLQDQWLKTKFKSLNKA